MEIIENGKYGNSFKTGNPLDCASMIEKIMIDYPDYLTLAEIAEKHVKKTFDIKATATCYLDNYHFLLDKKNKQ